MENETDNSEEWLVNMDHALNWDKSTVLQFGITLNLSQTTNFRLFQTERVF